MGLHRRFAPHRDERLELTRIANTLRRLNTTTRDKLSQVTTTLEHNARALDIQFRRIAQMQVEIDRLKAALMHMGK
jgi:hypothetical protein